MFKFKNKTTGEIKKMSVKPKERNRMFWANWELEKEKKIKTENKRMKKNEVEKK